MEPPAERRGVIAAKFRAFPRSTDRVIDTEKAHSREGVTQSKDEGTKSWQEDFDTSDWSGSHFASAPAPSPSRFESIEFLSVVCSFMPVANVL